MEENHKLSMGEDEETGGEAPASQEYVVPGVPIVRTSTPRPAPLISPAKTNLPLAPSALPVDFPVEAPDAPPLPEEPVVSPVAPVSSMSRMDVNTSKTGSVSRPLTSEFIWLFEYNLDMDPVRLNRPDRLDGSAFAYGPAVLKGYRLSFEGLEARTDHVVATLEEARDQPEAEVWGILYRVPRRFTRGKADEMPLLDKVHLADTFVQIEVQVREPYRQRDITCITYIASEEARRKVGQMPEEDQAFDPAYFGRLLQTARRQKLPVSYLQTLEELVPPSPPTTPPDQDTEPLPAVIVRKSFPRRSGELAKARQRVTRVVRHPGFWEMPSSARLERWFMAFALYISLLLLCTLLLAIFQGLDYWPEVFNNAFTPLGIPWYVLLYGLLGGCVSCLISLNRPFIGYPPVFVVLTWFIRPFLGALLGALAYLVLASGVILVSSQPAQHFALCSAIGALAGSCEGKLLSRRK